MDAGGYHFTVVVAPKGTDDHATTQPSPTESDAGSGGGEVHAGYPEVGGQKVRSNGQGGQITGPQGVPQAPPLREPLRVCIGFDHRQIVNFTALVQSILINSSIPVAITPLILQTLPVRRAGQTPFAFSRFIVPSMFGFEGTALFLDVDQLVLGDIAELAALADDRFAVQVVKNPNPKFHAEWASVMLFNCNHPDNRKLTVEEIENGHTSLHKIGWTEAVGDLPLTWNELVGYTDEYERDYEGVPKLAHYTQGVPAYPETVDSPYAELWQKYAQTAMSTQPWPALMGDSVHARPVIDRLTRTGNIDKLGSTLMGPQEAPTPEQQQGA